MKGILNGLTMQRNVLHLGYRRLQDGTASIGRVFIGAKDDRRQLQTVMSILATHLVPIPDASKVEVRYEPKTFTAPKQMTIGPSLGKRRWGNRIGAPDEEDDEPEAPKEEPPTQDKEQEE